MESAGNEGLFWAADKYSPLEGTPFRPFAQVVIDRAIYGFLKSELRHQKLRIAASTLVGWGSSQVFPRSADTLDVLHDGEVEALHKLRRYVDLKVLAGAMALCVEAENGRHHLEGKYTQSVLLLQLGHLFLEFSEQEKALLYGVYWEGKTVDEAGESCGLPGHMAKSRLRGLLGRLRKALAAAGHEGFEEER